MPDRQEKTKKQSPEKFRTMARAIQKQIDAKLDPAVGRQRMTRRRAAMASSANEEGRRLLEIQGRLLAIAEALEEDRLPATLTGLTSRAQVEELFRSRNFTRIYLHDTTREYLVKAVDGLEGTNAALEALPGKDPERSGVYLDHEQTMAVQELLTAAKKACRSTYWLGQLVDRLRDYARIVGAGIKDEDQYKTARNDLVNLSSASDKTLTAVNNELERKKLERSLIGVNIPGYFPTPKELAAELVSQAGIGEGMRVLEPSAGKGDILDAISREHRERDLKSLTVDAVEINGTLCAVLEKKGYEVVQGDFLERDFSELYDRIVMNPPFENGQDIEHVLRAYELLKPGGRVAAIMSEGQFFRGDKKATEFRDWLEVHEGQTKRNTSGAFYDSDRPTGVTTRIVVITKQEDYSPAMDPETERDPVAACSPGM